MKNQHFFNGIIHEMPSAAPLTITPESVMVSRF